ncbi:MAG: hypothetical protein JNM62_09055 [Flavobacteriales bacterium]|nr:hypothetical protein [Flavobacteriales bacterium]
MRNRNEWLAWAATVVGSLGLVGLAAAQQGPQGALDVASADGMMVDAAVPKVVPLTRPERMERAAPISDDGWSTEVPITRQVVVARQRVDEPLNIDLFNERGEVLEHVEWTDHEGRLKPLALDALVAGRYALRVTGADRSQVIRFRRD